MPLILCEHITLYSKRDFADVTKRTDLKIKRYYEFKCRPDLISWALRSQETSLARVRRFMKQSKVWEIPKWEEFSFWCRPTFKNQRSIGDLKIVPSWKLTKKLRTSVIRSKCRDSIWLYFEVILLQSLPVKVRLLDIIRPRTEILFDLQTCETISMCCFKLLNIW